MSSFFEALEKAKHDNLLYAYQHPPYLLERELARAMMDCDRQRCQDILCRINTLERAVLSVSALTSMRYSLVASCTTFTRTAIDAGVDAEAAFIGSDYYIRLIDCKHSVRELQKLEYQMMNDFIDLIERAKSDAPTKNKTVNAIAKYIQENVSHSVTLSELSKVTGLHPKYISAVFSKETGVNLSDFIVQTRIAIIIKLLLETKLRSYEISEMLGFSNASNFLIYFRNHTGMTPNAYRKANKGPNHYKLKP